MRLATQHLALSLIVALAVRAFSWADTPEQAREHPLATRQNFFTIPFTVDGGQAAAEVQLYVSVDRGRTWQLYAREQPHVGKFQFRAARDGEYWFASRTVFLQGYPQPPAPQRAELRVLIDTSSPQLDLTAQVGPAGELQASWKIADANLVADSFMIYFRYTPTERWQPVAVELPQDAAGEELSGRTTWWPQRHGTTLEVRAEVKDRAGNTNVVQRSVQLPNLADRPPPQAPPRNDNFQPPPAQPGGSRFVNNPVEWPADDVTGNAPAQPSPIPDSRYQPRRIAGDDLELNGHRPHASDLSGNPQAAQIGPEVGGFADDPVNERIRNPVPFDLPPGERPQMTRQRRFSLDYDIAGIGPSGVARVELWATRDGGRLWQQWGVDEDRRSPMPIELDAEGIYGFRIVVQSGNGLVGQRPRSGDPAEVWVGLDETPPEAQITSAQYGRGQAVGTLTVFWQAQDVALHPRPVTLLFSGHPDGPWTTIAAGLPNTGRYDWRVNDDVPANIYLRLEVRDEAGNLAVHRLERPIANDGLIPRGRIRGIQPLDDGRREASRDWPRW